MCKSPALFQRNIKKFSQRINTCFFDEVQHLDEAGLFLKGLGDLKKIKYIFATGSSSFHLNALTRESLAGRAMRHILYPFCINELISNTDYDSEALFLKNATDIMEKMAVFGGYPEAVLSMDNSKSILRELLDAYIQRDASDMFSIKHPEAFRKLVEICTTQIGQLVNYSEWAAILGLSNDTVIKYINILEESHIIKLLRPFRGGKRSELKSTPKLFFIDNGLRNIARGGFSSFSNRIDKGMLFENLIFSEILKLSNREDRIYYWRTRGGAEVDFIIEQSDRIIPIEVKSGFNKIKKPGRSVVSFIKSYSPDTFITVSPVYSENYKLYNTNMKFITPFSLMSQFKKE